jgi:HAD superfamily phosphatase
MKPTRPTVIFDMDGVLVEVSGSYRQAIINTVEHFTGRRLTFPDIQFWKNKGGFNNDWILSHRLIQEFGRQMAYEEVMAYFQQIYLGRNHDGLLLEERWMARDGALERLAASYRFALFTGRLREEALFALRRFAPRLTFDPIVGMDDVKGQKPDPEGLYAIRGAVGSDVAAYIGDTGDDLLAAKAAGIPFIGVVAPDLPHRDELHRHFETGSAKAIIADINELEGALCPA